MTFEVAILNLMIDRRNQKEAESYKEIGWANLNLQNELQKAFDENNETDIEIKQIYG